MAEVAASFVPSAVQIEHEFVEPADLRSLYYRFFEIQDVSTPILSQISQSVRYQVYCVENAYETESRGQEGVELDEYDAHAESALMFHRPTGLAAGTVRMVRPLPEDPHNSFALQRLCEHPIVKDPELFPVLRMGEVSRFCVPKDFRRRVSDRMFTQVPNNVERSDEDWRRVIPNTTLGLIEWLVKYSVDEGLTHWCAMMEPRLLRLLTRLGIHFNHIGGLVDFHGPRQPCVIELASLLRRVRRERPDVWDVISCYGRHYEMLVQSNYRYI